jgi:nucleotide-binding universal stress UspA family protein
MANQHAVLVAVNQSPASMDAVAAACMLAKQRKARVTVLHVIEVLRSLPLNAGLDSEMRKGEAILRHAEERATQLGVQVTRALVQAREAGPAIVDEGRDEEVDTIVLGLGYKRVTGSFEIGHTTDFVLKNAQSEVWVVRPALNAGSRGEA